MPRSSRSHSTQVPAESITASTPQVAAPPTRKATIGKVPAAPPGVRRRARARAGALVEHAAGAEGRLGQARRVQPWPTSEACWSPAMPQMRGAPGRAVAGADRARRVDDARQHGGGDAAAAASSGSSQSMVLTGRPAR